MIRLARRGAAALASTFLAIVLAAPPGFAHATLEATSPADRARLDEAPREVVLTFSEAVSAPLGAVQVVDADGGRVDRGDVSQSGGRVSVPLVDGLGDGAYVVTYRVISADAHPIRGALAFTVGDGPAAADDAVAAQLDEGADRIWEVAGAVARWVAYLGALLAAGGAVYLAAVDTRGATRVAEGRVLGYASVLALLGLLASLPISAHLATGLGMTSLFRPGVAGEVLGNGVGLATAAVFTGLALITAGLASGRGGVSRTGLLAGAGLAVGGFAISGHTAASDPRWLAVGANVVHLAAGAVWFGGLVLLGRSLLGSRSPDRPEVAGRLVARFSVLATAAILAVGAAGVALGWSEVRTVAGLTGTTYGRLLLAKVAVVALVAAAGAYNHLRLVPAVTTATASHPVAAGWRLLRRTVRFEVAAMVVALGLTAVLVNVTPARAQQTGPASTTVALGDGSVNVVVDPATSGHNEVHLYLLDDTGRPADLAGEGLVLELELPAAGIGPIVREPDVVSPGHHQLDGNDLTIPGAWQITVIARPSRFEQLTATAEIRIRP